MKLKNERQELFAQQLAKGKSASKAYAEAGYRPCRQNASRLSSKDDIKKRVSELKSQRQIDSDQARDEKTGQFLQGSSGNPAGRPRGSRNKLAEQFIVDLHEEWGKSGKRCLERVATDDPAVFVRVVAGILPKEIDAVLSVDTDFLAEIKDFHAAWQMARKFIGSDDDAPMIELQPEASDAAE